MIYEQYLSTYHRDNIEELLKDNDENRHHSININFVELFENNPNLGKDLLKNPERSLEEWNNAAKTVQNTLTTNSEDFTVKKHVHCRIYSLIRCPELHKSIFPRNDDANKFLQVSGTVVRMTCTKILEFQRKYHCNKCKHITIIKAEIDRKNTIVAPKKCENCDNTTLKSQEMESDCCKDYQEIKIQETVTKLDFGCMPNSMWVILDDDLVDSCKPGDNITVCGIVKRRWNTFTIGKKLEIELVLYANHIQVNNNTGSVALITPETRTMFENFWETYSKQPLAARDMIIKSICPQIFGLYIVKLAIAVVLAGGSSQIQQDNCSIKVRSEPHLLLVGDPGTGKSQLLRFASRIIPRSVLTTGVGSTAAGLTVTAVMENGEWQLEGGALVLADGGICCIDEFNSMKEHDRTSIHEAMEQQTISVAKASIVCKLSTKCSILAATNPKGNLDPAQPLCMNIALASPLLSRFDLILLLRDKVDQKWDNLIVDYILNDQNSCKLTENISWTIETLQAYFAIIKKNHPKLTPDSHQILSNYYQAQRRRNLRNKSRTTVRLLDSLIRLSQGHARLMFHKQVEIIDAIIAVILIETTMDPESTVFNLQFDIQSDFPLNPMDCYKELVDIILRKLQLETLLEKELENLSKLGDTVKNVQVIKETTNHIESKYFNNQPKVDDKIDLERNIEVVENRKDEELEVSNEKKLKRTKTTNKKSKKIKLANEEIINDLTVIKLLPSINDPFASLESNQDINFDIDLDSEFNSNNQDIVTSTQASITNNTKESTNGTTKKNEQEHINVNTQTTNNKEITDRTNKQDNQKDINLANEFNLNNEDVNTSTQTTTTNNTKESTSRVTKENINVDIEFHPAQTTSNEENIKRTEENNQHDINLDINLDDFDSSKDRIENVAVETRQEVLSQKTKRRNFFDKFRFEPKQDDSNTKPQKNSIFEDQNGEINDIDLEL